MPDDPKTTPCRYACAGFPMCGCNVEALHDPAAYHAGWQDANHAWQAWLDKNIPDWDTMTGVDLATLPQPPSMGTKE